MQDTISAVINDSDMQGKYLDAAAIEKLKRHFDPDSLRVRAASAVSAHAADIVKAAVAKSLIGSDTPANSSIYATRRYASCIRDLDYFLRYASYAMLAGDTAILDERVLNGLKETYQALGVATEATIAAIEAMKEVVHTLISPDVGKEMAPYFDHICAGLR